MCPQVSLLVTAPTMRISTVSPPIPTSSVPTAALFTRCDHSVETMMRTPWAPTINAVTSHVLAIVPV